MSSEEEAKVVKKNDDAPIIEEWVSDDEEEDVSQPKIEKRIVSPILAERCVDGGGRWVDDGGLYITDVGVTDIGSLCKGGRAHTLGLESVRRASVGAGGFCEPDISDNAELRQDALNIE
ncbi:hypothetical protein Tco_0369423 [Tanacetum coccineum]